MKGVSKRGDASVNMVAIGAAVLIPASLMAFSLGLGSFSSIGGTPNVLGATQGKPMDATDPKIQAYLTDVSALSDPVAAIRASEGGVSKLSTSLDTLSLYVAEKLKDKPDELKQAQDSIKIIQDDLNALADLGGGVSATALKPADGQAAVLSERIKTEAAKLKALLLRLAYAATGDRAGVVKTALEVVRRNGYGAGNGDHKIPYVLAGIQPPLSAKAIAANPEKDWISSIDSLDCSGLVSFAFIRNQLLDSYRSTDGLRGEIGDSFINLNERVDIGDADGKGANNGTLDPAEVKRAAETGVLKPGDIIVGVKSAWHAMMIVGSGEDGLGPIMYADSSPENRSIVHSTMGRGGNGPQITSLAKRAKFYQGKSYGRGPSDGNVYFLRARALDS